MTCILINIIHYMKSAFCRIKRSTAFMLLNIWFMTVKKMAPTLHKAKKEFNKHIHYTCKHREIYYWNKVNIHYTCIINLLWYSKHDRHHICYNNTCTVIISDSLVLPILISIGSGVNIKVQSTNENTKYYINHDLHYEDTINSLYSYKMYKM